MIPREPKLNPQMENALVNMLYHMMNQCRETTGGVPKEYFQTLFNRTGNPNARVMIEGAIGSLIENHALVMLDDKLTPGPNCDFFTRSLHLTIYGSEL